jgi:hypothetical protein
MKVGDHVKILGHDTLRFLTGRTGHIVDITKHYITVSLDGSLAGRYVFSKKQLELVEEKTVPKSLFDEQVRIKRELAQAYALMREFFIEKTGETPPNFHMEVGNVKVHPTELLPGDKLVNGCSVIYTPEEKDPALGRWICEVDNPGYGLTSVLLKDGPVEVISRA